MKKNNTMWIQSKMPPKRSHTPVNPSGPAPLRTLITISDPAKKRTDRVTKLFFGRDFSSNTQRNKRGTSAISTRSSKKWTCAKTYENFSGKRYASGVMSARCARKVRYGLSDFMREVYSF